MVAIVTIKECAELVIIAIVCYVMAIWFWENRRSKR
jgi:hypothetical protein